MIEPIVTRHCRDCGTPFDVTADEQRFVASQPGFRFPRRCPRCRAGGTVPAGLIREPRRCVACGAMFVFEVDHQIRCLAQGWPVPRRCSRCRGARRRGRDGRVVHGEEHNGW